MKRTIVAIIIGITALLAVVTYDLYESRRYYGEAEPVADLLHSMPADLSPTRLSEESVKALLNRPKYQLLNEYSLSFGGDSEFWVEVDVNKRYLLRMTNDGSVQWEEKD